MPSTDRPDPSPPRGGIYRTIQILMILDVIVGVGLFLAGWLALDAASVATAGAGLAIIGAVLFVFFRLLARRRGR